jgi:hypothetical protein
MRRAAVLLSLVVMAVTGLAPGVHAHGLIGKRFFPATLTIDDPFVADELSFPTVQHFKNPAGAEGPATRETAISAEFSKRLSPNLGLSLGGTFKILDPDHPASSTSGFDNMEVALKYVFFKNPEHETLLALGLGWDVGGTGSAKRVGAESFDTVTPSLFFGKGFGDLPDSLEYAKPLALTGVFGVAIPTKYSSRRITVEDDGTIDVEHEVHPAVARWGLSLQYSLQYLQSYVRDVGLPAPLNRMIPLVEFSMQTPIERPRTGHTTGTINPGVIWFGRYVQIGVEVLIPVNRQSGKNVGVVGQLHFYLDDILPQVFTWTPFHGVLGPTQPR